MTNARSIGINARRHPKGNVNYTRGEQPWYKGLILSIEQVKREMKSQLATDNSFLKNLYLNVNMEVVKIVLWVRILLHPNLRPHVPCNRVYYSSTEHEGAGSRHWDKTVSFSSRFNEDPIPRE